MAEGENKFGGNLDDLRQRVNELSKHDKNIEYNFDKSTDTEVEGSEEPGGGGVARREPYIKTIRTYKSDVASTIKKQKTSVVSAITAELEKDDTLEKFTTKKDKAKLYVTYALITLAGLFVIIGIALIFYFTLIYQGNKSVLPPEVVPSFIFTEQQEKVDLSGTDRRSALQLLTNTKDIVSVSLDEVALLYLVEGELVFTAGKFLTHIDAQVSGAFLRSLADDMNIGVHVFKGNQPFIIFKTNFYENSFAGMLQWEKNMNEDLAPLFGPVVQLEQGTTTDTLFSASSFRDKIFKNKDTRILTHEGKTILMYSFVDKNTILLTTNEDTFEEIITRITSNRI